MKPRPCRPSLVWFLAVVTGPLAYSPLPAADREDPYRTRQVQITIPPDEYAAMQPRQARGMGFGPPMPMPAQTPAPDREVHRNTFGMDLPWAKGTVTVDGETFADVGVRYKGNGTIGDASRTAKKSFKIDLDRQGGSGRFQGSKTINLHCGVADPSKYREAFGYGIYRAAGVPAPRTTFAEVRLTVPGKWDREYLGLYTITEEIDKPFLRRTFGTDKGLLMKPEGVRGLDDWGDDWNRYKKPYAPKRDATAEEAKRVMAFARLVQKADDAAFNTEIASYLDVDGYLRYLATTSFVANPDSFFTLGHNFCVYLHPDTKRFHFFPWDLDRAFANLPVIGTAEQQMDLSLVHPYGGTHRLTERVLALPGMTEKYRTLVKELTATAFSADRLLKELAASETAFQDILLRDTEAARLRRETPPSGFPFGKPPTLKTFVEKRTASVAAQLAGKSKGHLPTGGFGPGEFKMGDALGGPLMASFDADKDGKMSRDEWLAVAKRLFTAADTTAAGRIDQKGIAAGLKEMLPKMPDKGPPPPGFGMEAFLAGPVFTRADEDKDGKITAAEIESAAGKLFDEFDKKKDGKLDNPAFAAMLTTLFPPPKPPAPPAPPKKGP
ncbi:CotH kinase family protein [Limnoglobus roseus]|uniref:Spore coat protein CotH n=1 Tax=Limnoglobus roseus TaxID=2598579 RepID=A0A5C1AE24_9BACT|nr:CotH kinase family protein [Limnoglobus roseus]QEL16503.1 spore coat protein CotH [Limnoglobus roseus]